MTKKKYVKDAEGNVRGINTSFLQLEKPLLNENYDINIQNSNMDKIDKACKDLDKKIKDVQGGLNSINLNAENINYDKNECANVDSALDKLFQSDSDTKTSISNLQNQLNGQISRAKIILTSLSSKVE